MRRVFVFTLLACLGSSVASAEDGMEALLSKSCLECHDDLTKKGDLSLESLDLAVTKTNAEDWERCLIQLERGFMPPASEAQPTGKERERAIRDLENRLVAYHAARPDERPQAVLRRLNAVEYGNTIRDLLELEAYEDLAKEFPGDERFHGFASNGETLVTSNFLLRQYLEAAERAVARAVHFEAKPEVRRWDMKPPFDRTTGQEQGQAAAYYQKIGEPQPYQDICQRIGAGGAPYKNYHPLDDISDEGVPVSGWYRVRLRVEARFRNALRQDLFKRWSALWDGSEPIRLALFTATLAGIDPANREARDFTATHEQADQKQIGVWDLPDDEETWIDTRVWLERGQFLRLGFPNGPTNSNYRMNTYFKDLAAATLDAEGLAAFQERETKYGGWISFHFGESPRIRLYEIALEGPLNDTWPPESHRAIFGKAAYDSGRAEEVLRGFATRAWRRPAAVEEIAPLIALVRHAEESGMAPELAIQEGLKAVLCSPGFLYREEAAEALNDYELASRLSYFLTASMPDEPLLGHARAGDLKNHLKAEAERLLADPKSDDFVGEFLDGWLRLDKLGSMAPDPARFRNYYDERLEPAMRTETRLFFRHLLDTNGPVRDFIDSDYTFANEELAVLYGVPRETFAQSAQRENTGLDSRYLRQDGAGNSPTTGFARIALTDRRRGGLLGQASLLTLTANGVDTSPVLRGVWLLENILGTPPLPPPPNVPRIEPDIRGAKTIREQLEKHRESASCRSCHAHIDPPGFALESFDAIGQWRGHYRIGEPSVEIDSSGRFGATEFSDIIGFKQELLQRQDAFARCLLEKVLLHALGRELQITDRPEIRKILDSTKSDGYRLRDLILGVVESDGFRRK